MAKQNIIHLKTIAEYHRSRNLPAPLHPLISLIDYRDIIHSSETNKISWVFAFYMIALKKNMGGKLKYGQQDYDFDEGTMFFIAPGQILKIEINHDLPDRSGWLLLVHPDFLWGSALASKIRRLEFFGYTSKEALFLSEQEEASMHTIANLILKECQSNIDTFSQQIIVAHLDVLLNYAERFYHRQFLTRKASEQQLAESVENILNEFFEKKALHHHLPTVNYLAETLNLSPDYLSSLLKIHTGLNAQQHIHEKIIACAKERLSTTNLSVGQIAFELGFEHHQSFSKLFKSKTNQTPKEFRISFN